MNNVVAACTASAVTDIVVARSVMRAQLALTSLTVSNRLALGCCSDSLDLKIFALLLEEPTYQPYSPIGLTPRGP